MSATIQLSFHPRNIPSTSKWLKMPKGVTSFVARLMSAIGGHGSQPLSCACSSSIAQIMASTHLLLSPALTASVERRCKYLVSHFSITLITNNSGNTFKQVSSQRVSWRFQVQGRLCWLLCYCHPWGMHRKMRRDRGLRLVHPWEVQWSLHPLRGVWWPVWLRDLCYRGEEMC